MRALSGICLHDHGAYRRTLCGAQEDTGSHQDHRQEEGRHLSSGGWRGRVFKEVCWR